MNTNKRNRYSNWMKTFFVFFVFSSISFSQSITSSVDSTAIKIGSQFHLTIKANVAKKDKVVFPDGPFFGQLEVLESYPIDTIAKDDKLELIKKYGLTQFDSGRYVIPKLVVLINNQSIKTDSFAVVVNPVIVDTLKQQMYDIKSIIEVEKPMDWWWLYLILLLLGLAALGFGLYYFIKNRQTKKNQAEAILFASPIEKALMQLQNLEKKELWQKGETKTYYSELTDIARNYIEEAIEIPAMESTSNELYDAMKVVVRKKKIKLSNNDLENFKKVLFNADLVKFAKSKPLDFEIQNDKKSIDTFLISLDKAIPRSEEETENLFAEEMKRKKEKKQKLQRILIPASAVGFVLLLVGVFLGVTKGVDYVRENWLGHTAESLLKEEWITSDYGDPAISIATPKVLKRVVDERIQNNLPPNVKSASMFAYGSVLDNFSIVLKTTAFKDTTAIDLERALESDLKTLETMGAQNITVKVDDYEDPKGLTGKRAYGTFTALDPINNKQFQMGYEILAFAQASGGQELFLIYREDDKFAREVMDRVLASVELKKAAQ